MNQQQQEDIVQQLKAVFTFHEAELHTINALLAQNNSIIAAGLVYWLMDADDKLHVSTMGLDCEGLIVITLDHPAYLEFKKDVKDLEARLLTNEHPENLDQALYVYMVDNAKQELKIHFFTRTLVNIV